MNPFNKPNFAKPGEELHFFRELKAKKLVPVKENPVAPTYRKTVTTPYLFSPVQNDDITGKRPSDLQNYSEGINIIDVNTGQPVTDRLQKGVRYRIECRVANKGAAASYGGLCDFYIVQKKLLKTAVGSGTTLQAFAHTGFSVMPGANKLVTCPKLWTPATDAETRFTILAHIYDPFIDSLPSRSRYDARDRHVSRRDFSPDFNGTWKGIQKQEGSKYSINCTLEITQKKLTVIFHYSTQGNFTPADGHNPTRFPKQALNGMPTITNDEINCKVEERNHTVQPLSRFLCTWNIVLINDTSIRFKCIKHDLIHNVPDEVIYGDLSNLHVPPQT